MERENIEIREVKERESEKEKKDSFLEFFDREIDENGNEDANETLTKTKKKRGNIANLRPPIQKGEVRNPLGINNKKTELEKVIEKKVAIAVKKGETYLKLKAPHFARRVYRLSKEASTDGVKLEAAKTGLDRAGIGVQKSGAVAAVQINFGGEREEFRSQE